uniref:116kDa U5 small nuclear ribonucleoprotein component N-terminal domain-containing protein n=1 Tax=Timema shepardi TaxID=629360 RepID=A0A7R9B527_TIMSH|nr:unnamed protein product [Timema shepardi]
MDADLYDEFGNYIGPELESEDEEEESFSERQPDTQEYDEHHHLDVQQDLKCLFAMFYFLAFVLFQIKSLI